MDVNYPKKSTKCEALAHLQNCFSDMFREHSTPVEDVCELYVCSPSRIRVGVLTQGWSIHEVRPPAENDYACEDICVFQIFPAEKKRDAI